MSALLAHASVDAHRRSLPIHFTGDVDTVGRWAAAVARVERDLFG